MKRFLFFLPFGLMLIGCAPAKTPEVQIPEINNVQMAVSSRCIQLTGSYTFPAAVTGCGAELEGPDGAGTLRTKGSDEGVFSLRADGLKPDADYRVRVFIENERQIQYSDWKGFHTAPLPSFSLQAESGVFTATLHAEIGGTSGQKGFLFGESGQEMETYPFADGTLFLRNLKPERDYCFAAFVEMDGIREISEIQTFKTAACFSDVLASLDASRNVLLSARPMFTGEVETEASGFYLGNAPESLKALDIRTEGNEWLAEAENLPPCQDYWYCAYVTVGGKEYRSSMKQFETGVASFEDPVFWEYLLGNFDVNRDGQLSREEMDQVTFLPLFNLGIHSLAGIENFKKLEQIQMEEDALTHLDFSPIADCKINALVLRTPNLEQFILPAMKAPQTQYAGHFEVHSQALRGHWEFPDFAAGEIIIEAPLSSINLDKVRHNGVYDGMSLTLSGTEIEELDLSHLSIPLRYANFRGNEKLKVVWLPYGSGNSLMILKDPQTQIKYK